MDQPEVLHALGAHLDRRTTARLRAVSTVHRACVPKSKSLWGKLDTSPRAKIKMILRLGKLPHGILAQNRCDDFVEVNVRYGYTVFDYDYMWNEFEWFRCSPRARLLWNALKYLEYDSKLVFHEESFVDHLFTVSAIEKFKQLGRDGLTLKTACTCKLI